MLSINVQPFLYFDISSPLVTAAIKGALGGGAIKAAASTAKAALPAPAPSAAPSVTAAVTENKDATEGSAMANEEAEQLRQVSFE